MQQLRFLFTILLASIVIFPLIHVGIAYGYLGPTGTMIEEVRIAYYICMAGMTYLVIKNKVGWDIGTVVVILLAPYSLLSLGFYYIIGKLFPLKVESDK